MTALCVVISLQFSFKLWRFSSDRRRFRLSVYRDKVGTSLSSPIATRINLKKTDHFLIFGCVPVRQTWQRYNQVNHNTSDFSQDSLTGLKAPSFKDQNHVWSLTPNFSCTNIQLRSCDSAPPPQVADPSFSSLTSCVCVCSV